MSKEPELMNDKDIADELRVSLSWPRVQRHLRKLGLPHVLTVDPVRIGKSVRYVRQEFMAWLESQKVQNASQKTKTSLKDSTHQAYSVL